MHLRWFCKYFLIQFYVPFKIIAAHMRRANPYLWRKRENPEKNHLAHPQAELGLSHMWPERGSNPHQTQQWDDRVIKKQRSLNRTATGAALQILLAFMNHQ